MCSHGCAFYCFGVVVLIYFILFYFIFVSPSCSSLTESNDNDIQEGKTTTYEPLSLTCCYIGIGMLTIVSHRHEIYFSSLAGSSVVFASTQLCAGAGGRGWGVPHGGGGGGGGCKSPDGHYGGRSGANRFLLVSSTPALRVHSFG